MKYLYIGIISCLVVVNIIVNRNMKKKIETIKEGEEDLIPKYMGISTIFTVVNFLIIMTIAVIALL